MNPRAKGQGSVYEIRDGYWVGAVSVTDDTGTRKRRTVGSRDKHVAEAKLEALIAGERLPGTLAELHAVKDEAWHEGHDAEAGAVSPYWRAQK